jgi:hypothetical protein
MEPELLLYAFPLKADIENAPQNLKMELINLQCDTDLNQMFSETICQNLIPTCQQKISLCADFWIKNDCNVQQHLCK